MKKVILSNNKKILHLDCLVLYVIKDIIINDH